MDIQGRCVLVLGGHGLVGAAVCRLLLAQQPGRLYVASRQRAHAEAAAERLHAEFPDIPTEILPVWGDVFLRADWRQDHGDSRAAVLADAGQRARLIADMLEPLDDEIVAGSLLAQTILGTADGFDGVPAEIVIDCMNTATAVSYQDIYAPARRLAAAARVGAAPANWEEQVEGLIAALYVPQLVRHVQLLHEAMRRAGTRAYIKVGTTGTGGMGFNIPYTHGEERPSRLLLAKAVLAGAQTMLTFLLARTPGGPAIVKEVKPAAVIGWREISYGEIRRHGQPLRRFDCPIDAALAVSEPANLVPAGDFGRAIDGNLTGVYIDTGENGQFSHGEFAAITALGQMELVTAEEVAANVLRELVGANTGHDVVAALDAAVMGPSYRGGHLREAALTRLRQLEAQHGEAVAFEVLGPPRLSKLLFEGYLLKQACGTPGAVIAAPADELAQRLQAIVDDDGDLRCRILSIGLPILLADGVHLLRGPVIKSADAHHGWVDLSAANVRRWQQRLQALLRDSERELADDSSSHHDRSYRAGREWRSAADVFEVGEIAAWIFGDEDAGRRGKV